MINANDAWKSSQSNSIDDVQKLRLKVEEEILTACEHGLMWCLVPVCNYKIRTILHVFRELIALNYLVTQRNNQQGMNCFYIKWGHAHDSI